MLKKILGALILLAVIVIAVFAWMLRPADTSEIEARYMTGEDRYVEAAGQRWRVRETGPEDAPAIVLIHGFSHSLESFDGWADELDGDHRVIRFDLPGHALSAPREDGAYTVDDTVGQVAALLNEIAPPRFVIGGNSLGGLVAWRYAAERPERVAALVLVSPGGFPNLGVGDEPADVPGAVEAYLRFAPRPGVAQATAALYGDASRLDDARIDRIADLMKTEGTAQALIDRVSVFTLPDPEPDLARIEAPALIVWGGRDAMIPSAHAARFEAAMPDARALVYPGLGHMAMEEDPETTARDLRAFLDEVSGRDS